VRRGAGLLIGSRPIRSAHVGPSIRSLRQVLAPGERRIPGAAPATPRDISRGSAETSSLPEFNDAGFPIHAVDACAAREGCRSVAQNRKSGAERRPRVQDGPRDHAKPMHHHQCATTLGASSSHTAKKWRNADAYLDAGGRYSPQLRNFSQSRASSTETETPSHAVRQPMKRGSLAPGDTRHDPCESDRPSARKTLPALSGRWLAR
jgi:hypothetical protein